MKLISNGLQQKYNFGQFFNVLEAIENVTSHSQNIFVDDFAKIASGKRRLFIEKTMI